MDLSRLPTIGYDAAPSLSASVSANKDPDIPYSGSFYYNPSAAADLAAAVTAFITNGRRTLEWNPSDHGQSYKHFYNRLNAAKSYILHNPEEFLPEVVEELKNTYFAKRGILYVLARERQRSTSLAKTAYTDKPKVYHDPAGAEPHDPTDPEQQIPPPTPMPSQDFLPDDGDIETLLLNIDSWKATAPERGMFARDGVRLSPASIEQVRTKMDDRFVGRAEATRIRIVRVA